MQGGFLLDVVVCERSPVLQLLPCKYEPLLVGRYTFLFLNLLLDVFDGVARLDLKRHRLAGQRPHENLHGKSLRPHKGGSKHHKNSR